MADLRTLAANAATTAGVDPDFYTSLIGNGEGGFSNPNGVSSRGAVGPAQLMPGTARDMGVADPTDPAQNLAGGARYVRQLTDKYGDPQLVAAAYNAGPGAVDRHGGVPPYPETQKYVGRVMAGTQTPTDAEFLAAAGVGPKQSTPPAQRLPDGSYGVTVDRSTNPAFTGAAPTDDEFLAAAGVKPVSRTPAMPPTTGTIPRLAAQGGQGLMDSIQSVGDQIAMANPAGMIEKGYHFFNDTTQNVAAMIQAGMGRGGPIPTRQQFMQPVLDAFTSPSAAVPRIPQMAGAPQGAAERLARVGGQMLPGLAVGPAVGSGVIPQLATRLANVAAPTLGSYAASETARKLGGDEQVQQLAGGVGALGGGLATGVGIHAPEDAVSRAPTVAPQVADLAKLAIDKYGLDVRPSLIGAANERANLVKNGPAAIRDSEMLKRAGSGFGHNQTALLQDFTRAVSHTIGEDTPHLTKDAIDGAFSRIGSVFDSVGGRTGVAAPAVPQLFSTMDAIGARAGELGLDQSQTKALDLHIQKIKDAVAANGGSIPGPTYLNLTDSNSSLAEVAHNDHSAFGQSAAKIKDALAAAVAASAPPEDVAALAQARQQYRNLKAIQPLTDRAQSLGYISPIGLRERVRAAYGNRYSRGDAGNLGELADIGQMIGDATSDSGTKARAQDAVAHGAAGLGGAVTGALLGGELLQNPHHAIMGMAAGAGLGVARYGLNAVQGSRALSPKVRAKMIGTAPPPGQLGYRPPAFLAAPRVNSAGRPSR